MIASLTLAFRSFEVRSFSILLSVVLATSQLLMAQATPDYQYQVGVPVFSNPSTVPIQNGFVDLSTGNLHFEIPIRSFPQRGNLSATFKFLYDSRIWQVVNNGSSSSWQPTNIPSSQGGWRFISTVDAGAVTFNTSTSPCTGGTLQTWSRFIWTEAKGTAHKFSIQTSQNTCTQQNVSTGSALALDSSGYLMNVSNFNQAVVLDRAGNQVYPSFKDKNGNFVTSDSNGNLVDTLGRTPVGKTVNGSSIYYDALNSEGTTNRFTVTLETINVSTNFGQSGVAEYSGSVQVISAIAFPDGSSYSFTYDSGTAAGHYGSLTNIGLRRGGNYVFTYTNFADAYGNINQWVSSKVDSFNAGTSTWTFTPQVVSTCSPGTTGCQQQITVTTPASDQRVYLFTLNNGAWNVQNKIYTGSASSGTLLKTVTVDYDFSNSCPADCLGNAYVRPIRVTQTLPAPAGNLSAKKELTYDSPQTANVTQFKEWKFVTGSFAASPDRETDTSYLTTLAYTNANILNRITSVVIKNGVGTQVSQTLYSYDSTALTSITGVTHHDDTNFSTSNTTRGNLTQLQSWVAGTTYRTVKRTYDTTGQVLQVTGPTAYTRTYSYADAYYTDNGANPPQSFTPAAPTNAFVTNITITSVGQSPTLSYGYYYGSGKMAFDKDPMLAGAYRHYQDPLDRLTTSYGRETSGEVRGWKLFVYPQADETDLYTGITDATASSSCTSCRRDEKYTDQMGRPTDSVLASDPDGSTTTRLSFGPTGRIKYLYNPFRSTSDPTYGSQAYTYDGLDRVISLARQDGKNTFQIAYGNKVGSLTQNCSASTYGVGYPILRTDEAGKKRLSWYDGFGNLVELDEPNSSGTLNVATCYAYDALNNVAQIVQGSQTRTRVYDGLSRLTSRSDPESGTTTFSYANGTSLCSAIAANVCSKRDARGVTTTYTYDSSDRLTSIAFSDGTPTITYHYDQSSFNGLTINNGGYRMTGISDGSGQTAWSYDPAGHVVTEQRTIGSVTKTVQYTYNVDGSVATITYPNGHIITYSYNNAQRPVSVVDSANGINFAGNATYAPQGKLSNVIYGKVSGGFAGITRARSYNNRLQAVSIVDSSSNGTVQSYNYSFDQGNGVNNGSLASFTDNVDPNASQSFTYDPLNRIATAASSATSGSDAWGQSFGYDQYGNLNNVTVTQGTASSLSVSVNGNNQITNGGFSYDAAGNLTSDGTLTYTWNALNQLTAAAGVTYTYDAHGKRVSKSTGELSWYGLNGQVLAETDSLGNLLHEYIYFGGRPIARRDSNGSVYYYFTDRLHSGRTVTDSTGHVTQSVVYFPYGGEKVTGTFDDRKFTLKRRDTETNIDHAPARMYHPALARWLSVDRGRVHLDNPQNHNRYTYVLSNPVNNTDRRGTELDDDVGMLDNGSGGGGGFTGYGTGEFGDPGSYIPAPSDAPSPDPSPAPDPTSDPAPPVDPAPTGPPSPDPQPGTVPDPGAGPQSQPGPQDNPSNPATTPQVDPNSQQGKVQNAVNNTLGDFFQPDPNTQPYEVGGHYNYGFVATDLSPDDYNNINSILDDTADNSIGPGARFGDSPIGSLHVPDFSSTFDYTSGTGTIYVDAHIDAGNPNTGLLGMVVHGFWDGVVGKVVQFFGGDIDF